MKVVLTRTSEGKGEPTLGKLELFDPYPIKTLELCTLELPWRDNRRNISRIPAGTYNLKWEYSPKFRRMLWEIYGVPKRSECKFHVANFMYQLNGCIALGLDFADIDGDGLMDVTSSAKALELFHGATVGCTEGTLEVIDPI